MRVISGSAKGRPLKAVPGLSTRPTTDKVKEAIFSMIGPYFDGGAVLDLFAGTGGLAIEALSRGMDKAVLVDIEKKCIDTIRYNLQASAVADRAEVYRNDAGRALKVLAKRGVQFQLVFLDPPYRQKMISELIGIMEEGNLLTQGATIVVEHDANNIYEKPSESLMCQRKANYGDTTVSIFTYADRTLER